MTPAARTKLVKALEQRVEDNLQNEQFGVEELAEGVGMSRSHLHRKLKEATGQSVSQFIREYRLKKARQLLQSEELTVSESAYQVGFGSPTYFSTAFREFYGYPPGEARSHTLVPEQASEPPSAVPPSRRRFGSISNLSVVLGIGLLVALAGLLFLLTRPGKPVSGSVAAEKSIAVLPFKNLSSEEENQYFADGVMDAVLNKLAAVGDLRVTSRTSVEKYRNNTALTLPEIARELNVTYILEGSAQKYGEQIRIITQLINADNDQHLWSQDYTRQFEDVLTLQSQIAEQVASELQAALTTDEQQDLRQLPTNNPEAYNYYLLAEFQSDKWTEVGFQNSIPLYKKAIEVDSAYVDPYVGLAQVWSTGGAVWGVYNEQEAWDNCRALLEKALELDPTHIDALETLASGYFYYDWDFHRPLIYFNRAKEEQGHYGFLVMDYLIKTGRLQDALNTSEYFIQLDPSRSGNYLFKCQALYLMGKQDEAIRTIDEAYSLFDNLFFVREAAKLYFIFGEMDKFHRVLEKHHRLFPDRPPLIKWLEAVDALYQQQDPSPYVKQLEQQYENEESGSPAWFLALTYAVLSDEEAIFDWLEKSYDRHEVEMTWLKTEPVLQPYQNHPQYQDLLERMNFSD